MVRESDPKGEFRERKREFEEEVISVDRISRMTSGGRRLRFRAVIALGDKKSRLGIGVAKANDVADAIAKARDQAKKDLAKVPLVRGTIPFEIQAKYGSSHLLLKPAAPGTGIIAGGPVRKALELAGIKDILSKTLGSQNKINNLKAIQQAFKELINYEARSIKPSR